ncbi:MAG: peptidoglycan endopeptidase [Sphingomonas sp.]
MAAARGAVGARFRVHGRAPEEGLDCVGLVAWALAAGGWRAEVPSGYRLRGDPGRVAALVERFGLVRVAIGRAGDVVLAASGPGQGHLAILTGDGVVHADAMLRRVVERPGAVPWPVIGFWRFSGSAS